MYTPSHLKLVNLLLRKLDFKYTPQDVFDELYRLVVTETNNVYPYETSPPNSSSLQSQSDVSLSGEIIQTRNRTATCSIVVLSATRSTLVDKKQGDNPTCINCHPGSNSPPPPENFHSSRSTFPWMNRHLLLHPLIRYILREPLLSKP